MCFTYFMDCLAVLGVDQIVCKSNSLFSPVNFPFLFFLITLWEKELLFA